MFDLEQRKAEPCDALCGHMRGRAVRLPVMFTVSSLQTAWNRAKFESIAGLMRAVSAAQR